MLCKLSFSNIKRSFKDYTIYFFTLVLGVAIFYVFNAIDSQTVMLDVNSSTYHIVKLMTNLLSGVSVFVSFILGFLIIYASRFLIKRRNKEFGIYMILGMSKRNISLILFLETLFIGIISLGVGLVLGVILSQLMSMLVVNVFEADMTKFVFVFSSSACFKTLFYFGIIYVLVMIFNTIIINKCKLIDLLTAGKKNEQVKMKNLGLCSLVFVISCIILGYTYYLITSGIEWLDSFDKIFIPLITGSVATFLIFWSVSGLMLRIVICFKKLYYKGLNSFVLRQFSSKINTMVFSTTIICLMLFITICVLSSSLSLKNSMMANIDQLAPADVQFYKVMNLEDKDISKGYNNKQIETSKLSMVDTLSNLNFKVDDYLEEMIIFNMYNMEDFTLNNSLGSSLGDIKTKYPLINYNSKENFIKLSDYNRVAEFYGIDKYQLNDDEYLIVADFDSMINIRNMALKNKEVITVFGSTLRPKYDTCQDGFVEMSSNHINSGIIVVPDAVLEGNIPKINYLIGNYNVDKTQDKENCEDVILGLESNPKRSDYSFSVSSKISIIESSVGLGALVTFIGIYLGIIFLISSAVILALKGLSDSSDNKGRYKVLKNIGADQKEINKALFKEIAIFFLMPLVLAVIHAIFGIKFCTIILESFGNKGLWPSIIMTMIFLIIIYGGYFLITYFSSKNIIKDSY